MDHEELKNLAAAHSLDALDQPEKAIFEAHLRQGCSDCDRLVREFGMAVDFLGSDCEAVRPRPELKEKLLSLIDAADESDPAAPESPYWYVMANEGEWISMEKGVTSKMLFEDRQRKRATMLVRMEAGSVIAEHHHEGAEELYVLEGDCLCAGRTVKAGDYHRAAPGSDHPPTTTENGCLMLIIMPLAA